MACISPRHDRTAFLAALKADGETPKATCPTAINLEWAVQRQLDVTPARYVTVLITERDICKANEASVLALCSRT